MFHCKHESLRNLFSIITLFSKFVLQSKAEENSCGINSINSGFRVVGGSEAIVGHIPWIVSLVDKERHFCGGSIISREWLLTAAHCVNSSKITVNNFDIIAGSSDRAHTDPFAMRHKPHSVIVHSDYDNKTYNNDIALVRVRPYFKFRHSSKHDQRSIGAVCLANDREEFINRSVTISGFGRISPNMTFASRLMTVNVDVLQDEYCVKKFGRRNFVSQLKICYGVPNGGKGSCKGDSGGPITVVDNNRVKQVAIVAFGAKKCSTSASVGTKIAYFRKWIRNNAGV